MSLLNTAIGIFTVANPISNLPIYLSFTDGDQKTDKAIARNSVHSSSLLNQSSSDLARINAVMSAPPKNAPTAVMTSRIANGRCVPAWLKGSKGSIKPLKSLKANMEQSFDELESHQIAE